METYNGCETPSFLAGLLTASFQRLLASLMALSKAGSSQLRRIASHMRFPSLEASPRLHSVSFGRGDHLNTNIHIST